MARDFLYHRRVQFAETDAAGVLHFSNYFRIMEEAEHALWRSLGLSVVHVGPDSIISWPRVSAFFDYLRPIHFEEEIEIALRITRLTDKSMTFTADFRHQEHTVARGSITAVCCATQPGRFQAIHIPDEFRQKLADYLLEPTDSGDNAPPP